MINQNEENRNCGCTNNNYDMNNSYNYDNDNYNNNMSNNNCNDYNYTREEMMERIKGLNFSIIELGLYLDTHPDDEKALCLHRKYCKEYRELTDKYQKVYGPLTILFPCNKWRWLEEPWPWEGGNY